MRRGGKNQMNLTNQTQVIKLPPTGNHLVIGPPGCGKTNLSVARFISASAGKMIISLITFNRTLRQFISSGTEHYPFDDDKIRTYIKWGINVLLAHGIKFEGEAEFEAQQKKVTETLIELVKSGTKIYQQDCILLDEAQDYTEAEVGLFERFSKQIFAVGDANQKIYPAGGGLERLQIYCDTVSVLKHHYRNGLRICRVADGLRDQLDAPDGLESTSDYNEKASPSSVEKIPCATLKDQAAAIIAKVKTQLRAYPDERIGIACPRHQDLNVIWEEIQNSDIAGVAQLQTQKEGYAALSNERRVCVTTVHGTKGMEFRALNIGAAEGFSKFGTLQRNLAYTAVTRAKTTLAIYHSRGLPGYLENAIAAVHATPPMPSVEDLFKKS